MTSLKIDSERQIIEAVLELKGEAMPIEIKVKYHLSEQDGKPHLVLDEINSSREWITALLNQLALKQNRSFEIPSRVAALLGGVIR